MLTEPEYEMDEAEVEPQHEPSLFSSLGVDEVEDDMADDAVPPPAYRPAAQTAPRVDPRAVANAQPEFVAPRPPVAGKPTPEALARLRAAIQKDAPRTAAPEAQPEAAHRARLGGIGSLINRMTGHTEEAAPPAAERRQPPMSGGHAPRAAAPAPHRAVDDGVVDPDQERIEIPAFLRRQAN
jgi:cell division protein FtsZ